VQRIVSDAELEAADGCLDGASSAEGLVGVTIDSSY